MLLLRPAQPDDCELLWHWVNEPQVRASAFSSGAIAWNDHVRWFHCKLQDPRCHIYIAQTDEQVSIGQIRFDCTDDSNAEIDVSLAQECRGSKRGTMLVQKGVAKLFQETSIQNVHAYIKVNNIASIKTFEKAGFEKLKIEIVKGFQAIHYQQKRLS